MTELATHGLDINRSGLKGRTRTPYIRGMGLLAVGGFAIGLVPRLYGFEGTVPVPVALIPVLFLAAGVWFWARLTQGFDALRRRMGGFAARVAYWATLAVAIPVGLVEGLSGVEMLPTGSIAVRRFIGPSVEA